MSKYRVSIRTESGEIRKMQVPASRWQEFIERAKRVGQEEGIAFGYKVESERRGLIAADLFVPRMEVKGA